MQPLLFCQYFLNFFFIFLYLFFILCTLLLYASQFFFVNTFLNFFSFFLSFVHYYYMQIILNDAYFLNFFCICFLISYPLYTSIIYYKIKNDTYFFKILLFSISCNLYIGSTMPFSSPKKFLNFLVFSIILKNSYIIQENYQLY